MPQRGPRLQTIDAKYNAVGLRVRQQRERLGITRNDLCGRIADVTDGRWIPDFWEVGKIERQSRMVTDVELLALAQALSIEPCWLLVGNGKKPTDVKEAEGKS